MKYKNPMAVHKTQAEKQRAFKAACVAGAVAWDNNGREYPLSCLTPDEVEYIGGAWRVQNNFAQPIQTVRGEEFVLGERLNRTEHNHFEFYRAQIVGVNCYGRFIIPSAGVIIAKYETDNETHWAYGNTIEQARAFLGISLYDKYMDLIHATACKKKISRGSK